MRTIRIAAFILASAFLNVSLASEPGQPLDCSDWVFLEPGLSCQPVFEPVWPGCEGLWCQPSQDTKATDVDGRIIAVRHVPEFRYVMCGGCNKPVGRTELVAWTPAGDVVLGYVEDRCSADVSNCIMDMIRPKGPGDTIRTGWIAFDRSYGRAYVSLEWLPWNSNDDIIPGLIEISGFTTTFELLQSYEPTTSAIGFHVPYMPEGFAAADSFDTYYGDLGTVGDWSQAQPLQYGYPATAPSVGDYLEVSDTLPSPAPGDGYYYVTAVNYQGQRRFGRQSSGGVMRGRNPGALPTCSE